MDNENNVSNIWSEIFGKQAEERRLQESEREIRYAERRKDKYAHRQRIEQAAAKICAMIEVEAEKPEHSPNDIALLAAALNHVTTAVHATENYAESMPYTSLSIGY